MQPQRETYQGKSARAISEEKMWHKGGDVNRKCHHYQASPGTWKISVKDWHGNEWQERKKGVPRTYTLPSTGIKAESQGMHGSNVAAKGGRRRWLLRKRSNLRIRWLDNVSCCLPVILRGCLHHALKCEMPALTANSVIC